MLEHEQDVHPPQYLPHPVPACGHPNHRGRTNVLAVLALALSIVLAPLGIVFGILGLKQIRQRGEAGRPFAWAGLIIGGSLTLIGLTAVVVVAATDRSMASADVSSPRPPVSSSGVAASASGNTSIALACQEIVPAIKNTATELQHDLSTNAAVSQINDMMSQINNVARATGDIPFKRTWPPVARQ